ncbi:MAG: integration host factor subunit beta [Planctomycetes bacterium]|nr:integration host factor subunit beta [Planctomycetota bacterium]MBI3844507.1 integration host factor subunit beta [Planctomycetota bacterium]
MATITKRDITDRIAERLSQPKIVALTVVQEFLAEMTAELTAGNRLEFREFGVFEVKMRAARKARNPQNGETVHIPARTVVHFRAGRKMKELVRGRAVGVGVSTADAPGALQRKE